MKLQFDKTFLKRPDAQYLLALLPRLKEKKIQTFTTLALTLTTFSIFSLFAIAPTVGTITDLKKQISDGQFVDQQLQQKITTLSVLQDNYSQLKNQLPAVYDSVPTTPDLAIFLGQLQEIAAISNVTVERVQTLPVDLTPSNPLSKYTSYSFAMDVDGTSDQTISFLKNLTSLSRLVSLEALSFGKTTTLGTTYKMSIRGSTYFQP